MQNLPIYFLVEWCLWAPCLLCIRNNTDSCHSEWTNVVSTIYICRIEENRIFRIRNEWNNSVFKNRPSAYQKCRWIVPDYEKQLYLHNVLSTCQMAKKKAWIFASQTKLMGRILVMYIGVVVIAYLPPCFHSQPSLSGLKNVCMRSLPSSCGILNGSVRIDSYNETSSSRGKSPPLLMPRFIDINCSTAGLSFTDGLCSDVFSMMMAKLST